MAAIWIKICGITSLEDAQLAVLAGADAVGFVFAASPRRVTAQAVRQITRELPSSIEKIGVFVDAPMDEILAASETAGLTGVQLHGESSADHAVNLRPRLEKNCMRMVQVVHYAGDSTLFARRLRVLSSQPRSDSDRSAVLVDTRLADKIGGTGVPFDWRAAQAGFLQHSASLHLIVAGGLHPKNVRHAIQTLRPWGVDVSSGVESAPGRKDHAGVTEFIRAARAAAMDLYEAEQTLEK